MTLTHLPLRLGLAALAVTSASMTARSDDQPSPIWFSLDVGTAAALTQDDYQQETEDAGFNDVTVNASDTTRFAWRLGAGWDLWRQSESPFTLATQIEWFSLGQSDLSYSGSVSQSELDDLYDALETIHPDSGSGLALGVSGRWQGFQAESLRPLSLGGEMGATYWWQRYELEDVNGDRARTDETNGAGWYGGLLADYRLTPRFSTRAGWRAYGLDSEIAQTLTLGLTVRLGRGHASAPVENQTSTEPKPTPTIAPIGQPDAFTLDPGRRQTLDVLANDTDPNGLPLRISWVDGATSGAVQTINDGTAVRYRHQGGNDESDTFQYWVTNGETEAGPVRVNLTLAPVEPAPREDRFQVGFDTISRLNVLANDAVPNAQTLTVSRLTQPQAGSVRRINGTLVYQHDGSTVDDLGFEYWVTNGHQEAGPVRVSLTVLPEVLTIPITFASMSTEIRNENRPVLNQLASWLRAHPESDITVIGHTDNNGDSDFNQRLSEQRAASIVSYLVSQGIDPSRLSALGYGDRRPVASNDSAQGRRDNRRVEVRLN